MSSNVQLLVKNLHTQINFFGGSLETIIMCRSKLRLEGEEQKYEYKHGSLVAGYKGLCVALLEESPSAVVW